MSYTALRVTESGVVLFDAHRRRLGVAYEAAFDTFAATAAPGIYGLRGADGHLETTRRDRSRLFDGIPVRFLPSPIADRRGPQVKTPSPSPWDAVRQDGVATLLTSPDGAELFESCTASVLAWDGATLVAPPDDAPRIASVSEAFLLSRHPHRRAPIRRDAGWALVLVNAVAGACAPSLEAPPFPAAVLSALRASLNSSARRP